MGISDLRKAKGDETRQRLLVGVFELVADEGLQGLTAGKLAKHVGVSKSTIFHHFSTIEELSAAAMIAWIDGIMASLEGHKYGDLEEYLEALGGTILAHSKEGERMYRASMAFLVKSLYDESLRESFRAFLQQHIAQEREVMAGLTGLPADGDVLGRYGALLAATLDGLAMHAAMTRDLASAQGAWAQFSMMFSAALQAEQSQHREEQKR